MVQATRSGGLRFEKGDRLVGIDAEVVEHHPARRVDKNHPRRTPGTIIDHGLSAPLVGPGIMPHWNSQIVAQLYLAQLVGCVAVVTVKHGLNPGNSDARVTGKCVGDFLERWKSRRVTARTPGREEEQVKNVLWDNQPLQVTIDSHQDGEKVRTNSVKLTGTVNKPEVKVTVHSRPIASTTAKFLKKVLSVTKVKPGNGTSFATTAIAAAAANWVAFHGKARLNAAKGDHVWVAS